jgi:DNA-binding transcriptional LysR family regulator
MDFLSPKGLSFERLCSLAAVFKHGGIAKTAPLNIARQNLIGRQLRELELFFGAKLLERRGKVITLNEAGRQLANIATQILLQLADYKRKASKQNTLFRIAAGGSLYAELVAPRLAELRDLHLEIHLEQMYHAKIFEALAESELDGAVAWGSPPPAYRLKRLALGEFDYALYGAKGLLSDKMTEARLWSIPFALVRHRDMSVEVQAKLSCGDIIHVDENLPALRLVETGTYAAILPRLVGRRLPRAYFRSMELPFLKKYVRKVYFCWNPRCLAMRGFSTTWLEKLALKFKF